MSAVLQPARYGLDGVFTGVIAALAALGLVMVASASVAIGEKMTGSALYFFERQIVFLLLGVMIGRLVFTVPMKSWEASRFGLLAFALFLLLVVLVPGLGVRVNSARRWLNFGIVRLQASEPARLALLMYLSSYIVRRQVRIQESLRGLAVALVPLGIASALLLAEPDFGAAAILLSVSILLFFLGGARLRDLIAIGGTVTAAMAVLAVAAPYRLRRLLGFVDPWSHAQDSGFQLVQSLIAVGRGHWVGVGLGNSVQKLLYLPEMHTDFIFAIFAEEFGLFGVAALIALFGVLVWRGFVIGRAAETLGYPFKALLCYGLSAWFGLQAMINMAVNMGILPTKGLTLPFLSYGGSSLITTCAMGALILRVDHENRLARAGHPSLVARS